MIVAGEKRHLDHLEKWWDNLVNHYDQGDEERFHTMETDRGKIRLFDHVNIITMDGKAISGQITYIFSDRTDIMRSGKIPIGEELHSVVKFDDIRTISRFTY
ncbi:hypothetical protein IKF84_00025 [Candidatus Saccharibacteria bacterium]|nr:hypothetical protein [Candidatus Saccharibacteria bacterium]